ncbi:hypothetical protein [Paenibacillus thalictri]|uniref:Uncharacterized protein n=1 Tax=Paenibacillus thalictri TaxID=2527873 RepID=A0A4Q9DLQ4_9BACL|nr:hypothetical protein [Paenibacillus thalictri]TBL73922.1 hypothetical protein EYB31_25810 [Paenibacillus thalictri]
MQPSLEMLIVGATFAGIGASLSMDRSFAIVERTTLVGHEFINSYRTGSDWKSVPEFPPTLELQKEFEEKRLLTLEGRVHLGGMAPIVFKQLLQSGKSGSVRFMTEVVGIARRADGYDVTLFDAGGIRTVWTNRIVDTTSDCRSLPGRFPVKEKAVCAVLHNTNASVNAEANAATSIVTGFNAGAEKPGLSIPKEFADRISPGAFASEAYLRLPIAPEADWAEARHTLNRFWADRPAELQDWTIAAVADEFAAVPARSCEELDNGWLWMPSAAFENPLSAMDAGYAFGKKEVISS